MLVLHASPHPDDELIAAPATLMALRDAGHTIVNVACSLGRRDDVERRRAELEEGCRRARFELVVVEHPFTDEAHGSDSVRSPAEQRLASELEAVLAERRFELVVGPSPHDRHPGHELVARAVTRALDSDVAPERWWLWSLWGGMPFPTTIVQFDEARLDEIQEALGAYVGELQRNDYRQLVAGRSLAAAVLAPEQTFGFGSDGIPGPYAEATCEVVRADGGWQLGAPRVLDPANLFPEPQGPDVEWWLRARSAGDGLRAALAQTG